MHVPPSIKTLKTSKPLPHMVGDAARPHGVASVDGTRALPAGTAEDTAAMFRRVGAWPSWPLTGAVRMTALPLDSGAGYLERR